MGRRHWPQISFIFLHIEWKIKHVLNAELPHFVLNFVLWFTYKDGRNTRIRFVNWLTIKDNNTESKIYQRYYLYKLLWWKFTFTKINLRFSSIGPKWLQKSSSPRGQPLTKLVYVSFLYMKFLNKYIHKMNNDVFRILKNEHLNENTTCGLNDLCSQEWILLNFKLNWIIKLFFLF